MSVNIDREGVFLAKPVEWAINPSPKSSAVALSVKYAILGEFNGDAFNDWSAHDVAAYGHHYWVKADGTLDAAAVARLVRSGLWDGKLSSVHGQLPPDVEVRITVQNETYNGREQFKVAWVNHRDDVGSGGLKKIDDSAFKNLEGRFGSLLRAAVAQVAKEKPKAAPKPVQETAAVDDDDLPF